MYSKAIDQSFTLLQSCRIMWHPLCSPVFIPSPVIGFFETKLPGHKNYLGRSFKKMILKTLFQRVWPYESGTGLGNSLMLQIIFMIKLGNDNSRSSSNPSLNSIWFLIGMGSIFTSHASERKGDVDSSVHSVRNVLLKCFSIKGKHY